jgi:hypothetical protein
MGKWIAVALLMVIVSGYGLTAAQETTPEAAALELTETITWDSMTAHYPAGWTASPYDKAVYLVNVNPVVLRSLGDTGFAPGEAQMEFAIWRTEDIFLIHNLAQDASPLEYLQADRRDREPLMRPYFSDEPEAFMLGDKRAAKQFIQQDKVEGAFYAIEYAPGWMILFEVLTAPGELAQWEPTALAIAASITYSGPLETPSDATPVPVTLTYTSEGDSVSVTYPRTWVINAPSPDHGTVVEITVANRQEVLDANLASDFTAGDAQIEVKIWQPGALERNGVHTPKDLLTYLTTFGVSASSIATSEIESIQVGAVRGVRVYAKPYGQQDMVFLAFELADGRLVSLGLHTAPGQAAEWESTLQAVAESITVSG